MVNTLKNKRSMTGNHQLLPASRPGSSYEPTPRVPTYSFITWTLGRGSVVSFQLVYILCGAPLIALSITDLADLAGCFATHGVRSEWVFGCHHNNFTSLTALYSHRHYFYAGNRPP